VSEHLPDEVKERLDASRVGVVEYILKATDEVCDVGVQDGNTNL